MREMTKRMPIDSQPADMGLMAQERAAREQLIRFSFYGAAMGVVGALAAWLLYHLINIFTGLAFFRQLTTRSPLYPPVNASPLTILLIPVVGGLLVGVMAKYGTDRIRGHGIPEAMEAVLRGQSRIGLRVAIFKPISAAIAVGTGGPFGAEGPVIQTGGAIGSLIGQALRLSPRERRILLACGGAAGMVGIFNTPLAAVALALELLLFEFRARSLIPVILASAVAAGCRIVLLGSAPMFALGIAPGVSGPLDLLWFVPLGALIGLCAVLLSKALYIVEEWFERLPIDMLFKPALGGLALGLIALAQPRVLGMGYTYITATLRGSYDNGSLVSLAVGKSLALLVALGSGTSGGLLAPMLLIGAVIGSGYGRALHALIPGVTVSANLCGIVAMSGLFSAAARAPLTSFLFAFELTGDYNAVLPLMVGCMVADIVARSLSRESVMTERLARRGLRVNQEYEARLLTLLTVHDVMTRAIQALPAALPIPETLRLITGEDHTLDASLPTDQRAHWQKRWTFPVVTADGALMGVITRNELFAAQRSLLDARSGGDTHHLASGATVGDWATHDVIVTYPDDTLDAALLLLLTGDYQLLPVVSRADRRELLGVLSRSDILRAWTLRAADETQRERAFSLRIARFGATTPAARRAQPPTTTRADADLSASELERQMTDTLTLAGAPSPHPDDPIE